ncbi:hypothetical protein [Rubrobacter indicoceani]|uniref:hypothetical protein n=1 Tax=Rubrobacter indicoceani TaxID=2051957 RepID=UPI0013C4943F|nr:hypothetical protein [Rubrobacter indicoceani]
MTGLGKRLLDLERVQPPTTSDLEARRQRRARMKAYFDRIARLRREGRDPSEDPEHAAVTRALARRRANRIHPNRGEGIR